MDGLLRKSWWMLALRGLVAVIFGVLALIWPNITLLALVALFAAYALVTAGVSIAGALGNRKEDKGWWLLLALGLVALAAGVMAIAFPAITALGLVLLMGANAFVTGIFDIAIAIRLRKVITNEWLLVLSGVLSIAFGLLVLLFPGAGALAMVWLVSFYMTLSGVLLLALAFRVRSLAGPTAGPKRRNRLVGA